MPKALLPDIATLLQTSPQTAQILGLGTRSLQDLPSLLGDLMGGLCLNQQVGTQIRRAYSDAPKLAQITLYDITETARRNFEPGGRAAALLFSRGVHAVIAHRAAHHFWQASDFTLAMALKSTLGRALSTDIHPAARIGAGFWLDHGLGCVIGETAVIGEDVSIWHNVTLGSTLTNSGPNRHPKIGDRVVIGAGATLLGNIHIGADANIAAGAIVLTDVPSATTFAGIKASAKGPAKVTFKKAPV